MIKLELTKNEVELILDIFDSAEKDERLPGDLRIIAQDIWHKIYIQKEAQE